MTCFAVEPFTMPQPLIEYHPFLTGTYPIHDTTTVIDLIHEPIDDCYLISFNSENIRVTVARNPVSVHKWISELYQIHLFTDSLNFKIVVGLDTEWLPNLDPLKEEDHPTAILQLCAGQHCLIIQLLYLDFMPGSLYTFLEDDRFVFTGIGIEVDVAKLATQYGFHVRNTADLNYLNRCCSVKDFRFMGLKKMAWAVLKVNMEKSPKITISKWNLVDLSWDQIEYAAIDAYVSWQLGLWLLRLLYSSNDASQEFQVGS